MATQDIVGLDSPFSRWAILGYLSLLAFAHEYGYWSPFHVQLLEHVGFRDIGKLALTPVLGAATVYVVQLVAQRDWPFFPPRNAPAQAEPAKPIFRGRWQIVPFALPGLAVIWGAGSRQILPEGLWIPAGLLPAAVGLAVLLGEHPLFKRFDSYLRLVLAMLPVVVFGNAEARAERIIDGRDYLLATIASETTERRYLGRVGDYVFLYDPVRKATELRELSSAQPLQLRRIKRDDEQNDSTRVEPSKEEPKAKAP